MPHGEYPEADQGKCRSCGFLSKHAIKPQGIPPPRFYEVEHSERITVGAFFRHAVGYREWVNTEPMCFRGKINLVELCKADSQPEIDRKLEAELWADRKCDGWYPYMPGLSPIEHYQDKQMRDYEQKERRTDRALIIAGLILAAGEIIAAIIVSSRDSYTDQLLRRLFGP